MTTTYQEVTESSRSTLFKWSAVFGGLILGLGLLLLLSALWLALAYGSSLSAIRDHLDWYIGVSAIVSLFVGAILTGYLCGVGRVGTGMIHGFALWALLMLVTVLIGIPSVLNLFGLHTLANRVISGNLLVLSSSGTLWASFWTILAGFIAAGIGGMIGGAMTPRNRTMVSSTQTGPAPVRIQGPDRDRMAE
jgi:hypothetical protein